VTVQNAYRLYQFARRCEAVHLKRRAASVVKKNAEAITKSQDFRDQPQVLAEIFNSS
jgi:hypothetical protein